MALLAPQQIQITGLEMATQAAAGGGDTLEPGDDIFLEVHNGDASDKTVTVVVPGTEYGQNRPDIAVVVTAGERRKIGPFPRDLADPTTGLVNITYSAVTSVTVALCRL